MTKKNHHYVPQFYLRYFSCDKNLVEEPKRIHLFNLKREMVKEKVSIKDQCYKRNFYGNTDEVENQLSAFESAYSQVLSKIITTGKLPTFGHYEYQVLLNFVIVQHLRSKRHVDLQEEMWNLMLKSVFGETLDHMSLEQWENLMGKGEKPITRDDLKKVRIGFNNPAVFALSSANDSSQYALFDLGLHLVLSEGESRFITSDNPVVLYNQYFQGAKDMSFTGLVSRGLQIFLPLSPYCLLILYDRDVYYVNETSGITRGISLPDLQQVNLLQFVNADQNVFFSKPSQNSELEKLSRISKKYRTSNRPKTFVFDESKPQPDIARSSMFHSFVEDLNINLNLQLMKLKRSRKKLTLKEKFKDRFRKEMPQELLPKFAEPPTPNAPKIFKKRSESAE